MPLRNNTAKGGSSPASCSVSVGPGQVKAAAIWEDFKDDELRFVDVLELCACLMVNVADKSESTDNEIATMVRRLMHDMRRNASRQNDKGMARRDGRPPCEDGLSPSPSPPCSMPNSDAEK